MRLSDVCSYVSEKIDCSVLNKYNYISTENLLSNCGGITVASNIPVGKAILYKQGDILFSNIRPYFKKLWKADVSGGCSADVLCIRANKNVDSTYLYYLLIQDSFISYVMKGTKGCKMPRGDKKYNMSWEINIHSIAEQRRIASILSSLDDKIANNRRICENLEAQAQALFKHWFIDFAPFKNGKFVESELGMIPEGWRVYNFSEFLAPSSAKVGKEGIAEYSVTNTGIHPRAGKFNKSLSKSSANNKMLCKGDLVFGMSREILNWGIMEDNLGGVSPAYHIYKIDQAKVDSIFLKEYIAQKINYFKDLIKASTREGQSLDKGALLSKYIYVPPKMYLDDFISRWTLIKSSINTYNRESSRLATLRDTLLPKLMSGQIKL